MDTQKFGKAFKASFEAQVAMFPLMKSRTVRETIEVYKDRALGWKLAGAGGGGYLVLVSENPIENAIRIRIRRQRTD
jgi:galactokinase/mevalonate kinase-like predicted kinase